MSTFASGRAEGYRQIADDTWAFIRPPGSWGETNTGLIVARDCASMLIDTVWDIRWAVQVAAESAPLVAKAPVTDVLNTHSDGDHWWGNDTVPEGARIITSAASLHAMKEETSPRGVDAFATLGKAMSRVPGPVGHMGFYMDRVRGGARFPSSTPRLPDHTFDTEETIDLAGRRVELRRLGPAHTAGDLIAHLPDVGVVFSGDLLFVDATPVLWHGPLQNWIDALDHLLSLDAAVYVPGHGPLCGTKEIAALRDYWVWVEEVGRAHFLAGTGSAEAARSMLDAEDFRPFSQWDSPERLILSMSTLYRLWRGEEPASPTLARRARAFADAGAFLRKQ